MRDRAATWFPIALLLFLAALTYWLNQSVQAPAGKRDGSTRHDPDYIIEKFSAVKLGPDGNPQHALVAEKMTHYPDDDTTELERPHFIAYPVGGPTLEIMADRGFLSSNGERADFTGNVRAIRAAHGNRSQLTVTTEFLRVFPDREYAVTNRPVRIEDAHMRVDAIGLELDNQARTLKLLSHVKTRYEKAR